MICPACRDQQHGHCPGSTWCDCGHANWQPALAAARQRREQQRRKLRNRIRHRLHYWRHPAQHRACTCHGTGKLT